MTWLCLAPTPKRRVGRRIFRECRNLLDDTEATCDVCGALAALEAHARGP